MDSTILYSSLDSVSVVHLTFSYIPWEKNHCDDMLTLYKKSYFMTTSPETLPKKVKKWLLVLCKKNYGTKKLEIHSLT